MKTLHKIGIGVAGMMAVALSFGAAQAQDARVRVYGYGPSGVYGYSSTYDRDVDGRVIVVEPGYVVEPRDDNRALGTYVPHSDTNTPESRDFFRGVTRQSGGN